MRTVEQDADEIGESKFDALPQRVQEALGELAGAAKEGLLALSVGVGLGVLTELMAEEVDDVVGPKGRHDVERRAVRHGHEAGSVTLGGRRVPVQRPRVRATDGTGEVAMTTYAHFADRDPLTKVVMEQMLAGVSTRRYARTREPVGQEVLDAERSASKSAVSREFVGRTGEHLGALMARSLADVRLAALMLDGLELKGRCCIVALGITTDGVKVPLGLWDGSTENKRVCVELLRPRRARPGLRSGRPGRPRRRQGAARGRRRGLRHRPGPALCAPQGTQRPRPPPRTRPSGRQAASARGLEADVARGRDRASRSARHRALALPSRRRGVAARGPRGDGHVAAPARR